MTGGRGRGELLVTPPCQVPPYRLNQSLAAMEGGDSQFSEASVACALQFLKEFTTAEVLPDAESALPLGPNWPSLEQAEIEGE